MSFMTSPPWTLPYGFASDGSIVRDMTVFDRATVFASGTGADASLARCPSSRAKSSARPSPARLRWSRPSTPRRSGVSIHGAVWDAGYSGRGEGLLSVLNSRGYRLQRGARVAQLVFFRLSAATAEGYKGRYHGENA